MKPKSIYSLHNRSHSTGFTLIEVLIALTILAISLTAIVKATSTDIENTDYLKNRALASLVAYEAAQLIELNAIGFQGSETEQETDLGGKRWFWRGTIEPSIYKDLKKVIIEVKLKSKPILTRELFLFGKLT